MKAGKVWGQTELLEANGVLEFHRIEAKAGGVCSKHKHKFKWNGFFVESGEMIIRVWKNNYDLVDETILGPGQYTKVAPGEYHQFEAVTQLWEEIVREGRTNQALQDALDRVKIVYHLSKDHGKK